MILCNLHIYQDYGHKKFKDIPNVVVHGLSLETNKGNFYHEAKTILSYDIFEYGVKRHSFIEMRSDMGFALYNIHQSDKCYRGDTK